jgi:hypothetical protein
MQPVILLSHRRSRSSILPAAEVMFPHISSYYSLSQTGKIWHRIALTRAKHIYDSDFGEDRRGKKREQW